MARSSSAESLDNLKQAETNIAVLQVQVHNTNDKIDGVKDDLKNLRTHFDEKHNELQQTLKDNQELNTEVFASLQEKLGGLEKWRWMIMGGAAILGGLGWNTILNLLGVN